MSRGYINWRSSRATVTFDLTRVVMAPTPDLSSSYDLPLDIASVTKINKLSDAEASLLPAEVVCGTCILFYLCS